MVHSRTISSSATLIGIGLHTGEQVELTFKPASTPGIVFRRTDLPDEPRLAATLENVSSTARRTEISRDGVSVSTVEHVLAAIRGVGVDDVLVDVSGRETPAMDGSAEPFAAALREAGIVETRRPVQTHVITEPFTINEGESVYQVRPADCLRLVASIDWNHPLIGHQEFGLEVTPRSFEIELSRARTFGFLREAEQLKRRGLIKGASEKNVVVLSDDAVIGTELRWADEFVRHKILDLLGDLSLLPGRLQCEIVAHRPSHKGNVAVTERIEKVAAGKPVMDINDIMAVLPHRYPLLLVDRIIEIEEGKRIVGIKNVTINEPFFEGHFPGHPIMPGVLIVEAMAQTGGMLMMRTVDNPEEKVVYFMSMDKVKFRKPVVPGDQLRLELELLKLRGKTCQMRGEAFVDGKKVAEAEMMAAIADR